MPTVEIAQFKDESVLLIKTQYRDRELIKTVPGASWKKELEGWALTLSWPSAMILHSVFKDRLEFGERFLEWAWEQRESNDRRKALRDLAMDPEGDTDGNENLYRFQRTGVAFMIDAKRGINGDEMGLGKTIEGIAWLTESQPDGKILIVAPKSMKAPWRSALAVWRPDLKVAVLPASPATIKARLAVLESEWDVLIVNWEQLQLHSRLAPYGSVRLEGCEVCIPGSDRKHTRCHRCPRELNGVQWGAVIADEYHRAKDAKSVQTRALKAITAPVPLFFGLTGTPGDGNYEEFWSLLNVADPKAWPSRPRFLDRYCEQTWNGWAQEVTGLRESTKAEFYTLRDNIYLARPKELVLSELPDIMPPEIRLLEMSSKQAKAYFQMEAGQVADVDGGQMMAFSALTVATRLSQLACSYAELTPEGKVALADPSNKIDALMDILEDVGEDEPIVCFAESRQLIELAAARMTKAKLPFGMVVGGQNEAERESETNRFQEGRYRALLVTLGAGGEGLTLTRSRIPLFLQLPWSIIRFRQALARVHRIGQERPVLPKYLLSEGTIEEPQYAALERKGEVLDEIQHDPAILAYFAEKGIG